MKRYNIIVADDHVILRDALAALINSFESCQVSQVAANGLELIRIIEQGTEPDIVLLDLSMPVMDGYATVEWLHRNRPAIRTLVLSMYDSEIALIRLLKLGARGFLKKDIQAAELKTALFCVAENGYYYSHTTTRKLASFFQKTGKNDSPMEKVVLSDTEIRFLGLASTDLTYKEIAHRMGTTPRAIDGYRDCLFEKLDVRSRVGMAIYALKSGMVIF